METTNINISLFDEYVELLKKNMELYDRKFGNNYFSLTLANGDFVNYKFNEDKIAHLLGVNVDEVRTSGIVRKDLPAYEILEKLVNHDITFSSFNRNPGIVNRIFSKNFIEKSKAFQYNTNIEIKETHCIIKYDGEKIYQSEDMTEKCDYYIVRRNEGKFYVLGLVKNTKNSTAPNKYEPVTSRMYDTEEELNKYLSRIAKKQEITYVSKLLIDNPSNGFHQQIYLYPLDKQITLARIQRLASQFDAVASVAKDLSYVLSNLQNKYQNSNNIITVIKFLTDAIKNRTLVSENDIKDILGESDIPNEEIKELIDACNDNVCNQAYLETNEQVGKSYSQLESDNKNQREELARLKEELKYYKDLAECYKTELAAKTFELELSTRKLDIFEEAYQKVKGIE